MTLHVLEIPHRSEPWWESFNHTARRFARMMSGQGYDVQVWGAGKAAADAGFDRNEPTWKLAAARQTRAMRTKVKPRDVVCVMAGGVQADVAAAFPHATVVEPMIGYTGSFAPYRVFASYSLMHTTYGRDVTPEGDGRFYDAVIPHPVDPDQFPLVTDPDDYYLYFGRLTERKGWRIAQDACQRAGVRFVAAGDGSFNGYGEYAGVPTDAEKAALLGNAAAVFCPTVYMEPFGLVAVEAQLCGTPVISTDWGAFTETVTPETGVRCRTLAEFVAATETVLNLDRDRVRASATARFAPAAVAPRYSRYFDRLETLWGDGWYAQEAA